MNVQRIADTSSRITRHLLWMLFFAACTPLIPATTPPQLQHTPGAYVVLDEHTIDTGIFQVAYPTGWRVVKNSIAAAPMSVVLVSPDDAIIIFIQTTPSDCYPPTPIAGNIQRYEAIRAQPDKIICIMGTAPEAQTAMFEAAWELVMGSLS